MDMISYRGESSIEEIIDKRFKRLSAKRKEKLKSELLKANPQLSGIKKMPKGGVIRIPDSPDTGELRSAQTDLSQKQLAIGVANALALQTKLTTENIRLKDDETKKQIALLKSAKFKKLLNTDPENQALAKTTASSLNTQAKEFAVRQKAVLNALEQANDALRKMID